MYSRMGRPSVPPEQMLRALLQQMLYTVRSERMLVEQLEYNLLFRWFAGLGMKDRVWDASSFTKNRERLLSGDVAERFFRAVLDQARRSRLLRDEHFTVDGTLIEAWASEKSYTSKPVGPPPKGSGHRGEVLLRDRHESKTDPEARRYGYAVSQKKRNWVERFFAWLKTTAGQKKTRPRGHKKLAWNITFAAAAYNLTRRRTLLPTT